MGKVYLVGAGPGHKDLITVRGLQLVKEADAVIYDSLLDDAILEETKPGCELTWAGKRSGAHSMSQNEINSILLDAAGRYERVVRLKGGDPFIFGRGGEEAMALMEAGIDFEIIPGISSSYAVPEHAGIPVTHRGVARSFHVITGHTRDDDLDYGKYAELEGTLVFLMGLKKIDKICSDLLRGGMDPKTPAAVISRGLSEDETVIRASLSELCERAAQAEVKTPAVIVVGETAGMDLRPAAELAAEKNEFPVSQADGLRQRGSIYIVGTSSFAGSMDAELRKKGLRSKHIVVLRTTLTDKGRSELTGALNNIERYSSIMFSSRNAVDLFFEMANTAGFDRRRLAGTAFAAIGPATAAALADHGYIADLVPDTYTGAEMAALVAEKTDPAKGPVLTIRAESGSRDMYAALDEAGVPYESIELYRLEIRQLQNTPGFSGSDMVILASASGARAFFEVYGNAFNYENRPGFACIGEYTAEQLKKLGAEPDIVASPHTATGLADAIASICKQ